MRMGDPGAQVQVNAIPTGALSLDLALGHRRGAARADRRGLRPGVLRQDDARLPHARRGPEARRRLRVHRRRARDGPALRPEDRRRHRRAARLPARLRRAGAGDRRHARALRRGRPRRGRLGGGADAARRARGADGRPDRRPAGADDEPGDAQARGQPQPHPDALPLHEPDPREGRRDVRLARDPARRPRAEVLLVPAPGHPPDRDAEGGHRGRRQPRPRQGRQEQGRAAVPAGRVRHRVRSGHLDRGLPHRPGHRAQHRHEVRLVLLLRRGAARPGAQQRQGVPRRARRGGQGDRGQDLRGAGPRPRPRQALRATTTTATWRSPSRSPSRPRPEVPRRRP